MAAAKKTDVDAAAAELDDIFSLKNHSEGVSQQTTSWALAPV